MEGMTLKKFEELLHFYNIEPFGEYRQELRSAKLLAFHHNIKRDPKMKSEPFTSLEFMDFVEKPTEKIYSQEEIEAYAKQVYGK